MAKTQPNTLAGSIESSLSTTTIFELLASERRQHTLQYLKQAVGAVAISDLADQIALWEGEHTRKQYERICTSLVHIHLPKLSDAGVIQYDPEQETIDTQETADQFIPYLELSELTDSQ